MPWSPFLTKRKGSIIILAQNQNALLNNLSGGSLRDIILATPSLLAYYEYEGIVMDGVVSFTNSPVDSGPNGYDWTGWDNQTPQFGGAPDQVQPYTGIVGECYKGSNEGRAIFPVPGVDAPPFMDDGAGLSLECWVAHSNVANTENMDVGPGISSLGEQYPVRLHLHQTPGPSDWDYEVNISSDTFGGSAALGTLIGTGGDTDLHHWVVTIDPGNEVVVYFDGVAVDTQPYPFGIACTATPPTGLFWQMDGMRIDETAYYQTVLTPAQVAARFNSV